MVKAMSVHSYLPPLGAGGLQGRPQGIGTTISGHNISANEKRRFRILHTF